MGFALPEIKQKGWDALVKELGYAGATKFMLLYEPGRGNYTEERKDILKETTIEKVRKDILSERS
jgi:tagatose-1,6-bisphosphate aldolase